MQRSMNCEKISSAPLARLLTKDMGHCEAVLLRLPIWLPFIKSPIEHPTVYDDDSRN